jgi:hypothetical protein
MKQQKQIWGGWGVLLLAMIVAFSTLSFGQAISGDLVGKVTDSSGAVVSNSTVEAVNIATGQKITTTTNANGEYHFSNLPIGHYKISATGNGLTGGIADTRVDLNKTATANIVATVGQSSTTVEVVEQAATIDTTTAQIQTNYDPKQAQDLPTASIGLGVLNLSLLQAGVASSGGIGVGTGPSVSGQRPRNNNFTVEGVDNNDKGVTGPLVTIPNDAVQQFTVLQNNFSPEFGHSSGGQFNTVIQSGTNRFHGRAYEYFQNRNLNAQDWQVARGDVAKGLTPENPPFDNNRYGGQLGGPIVKDKMFFFTNWEYNTIGQNVASSACAPTAAGYATLASLPGISANNLAGMRAALAPAPFADTTGKECTPIPTANGLADTGPVTFLGGNPSNTLTTVNSVDFNPTASDQIRFRYIYSKFNGTDSAAQIPSFFNTLPQRFHVGTFSEYHTFSPKITNEFRLGYNRFTQDFVVPSVTFPGMNVYPNFTLDDLGSVNIGPDPNAPQSAVQNLYQINDNVSWLAGKHNIKFGIEGRKSISPQTFTQRVRGDYEWTSTIDFLRDQSPDTFGQRSTGNPIYNGDQWSIYWFANDEFRVTSHLTLNLGLRYEFTTVPAAYGYQTLNQESSVPGLISFNKPTNQKNNYAPRVGFAYSPGSSGETSIRGGFAMAYDVLYDNLGLLSLPPQLSGTCNADNVNTPTAACPYNPVGFLAGGGLPAGGTGLQTFPTVADARANTAAWLPDQRLPYSESWNFGVQHIFAKKYIAEVRYVGTKGIRLPVQTQINIAPIVNASNALPTYLAAPTQATLNGLTSSLDNLFTQSNVVPAYEAAGFTNPITTFMPFGQSIYHGLQTQLTRNFTNGLQFQFAWTWSHMFDNSTADVFSTLLTPRRPQDFQNINADSSTSALDRRHRVTAQIIYDVPFFKKSDNWFAKNVVGNWEVAPVYTFQSPEYATVQSGTDSNLNGDAAPDRVVLNPGGPANTSSGVNPLFNSGGQLVAWCACSTNNAFLAFDPNGPWGFTPAAVLNPNARFIQAGLGTIANTPRNNLVTDHINNWDLTAVKRFSIREGMNLEFQAQAFNLFNHAQYVPGFLNQVNLLGFTGSETASFVRANSTLFGNTRAAFSNQPRTMQLALKFTF